MVAPSRTAARTCHPRLANAAHTARPMKPLAPVTSTAVTASDSAPDSAVYVVGVAEDDVNNLGRYVVNVVVGCDAPSAARAFKSLGGYLPRFQDSLRLDARHDHRAFV